jgi:hypothetical protein
MKVFKQRHSFKVLLDIDKEVFNSILIESKSQFDLMLFTNISFIYAVLINDGILLDESF